MDTFSENFHHTMPVEMYDDFNPGSLNNQFGTSSSESNQQRSVMPEFAVETYGKMIQPKSFDGKTDPRLWVKHYELIAEAKLWDDDMKVRRIIASLDGAAQNWFLNQRFTNPFNTWKNLKEKLIGRFSKAIDGIILMDRDRLILKRNEDFDSYWEEKTGLIKMKRPNMPQKEVMQLMFDGLHRELRSSVLDKMVERKCESAIELYQLIKEIIDIEQYKKELELSKKKRSENYYKNAELKDESSDWDEKHYNQLKGQVSKLGKEVKEVKDLIKLNLLKVEDEDVNEVSSQEEDNGSEQDGDKVDEENEDILHDSANDHSDAESSQSEDEEKLNILFDI